MSRLLPLILVALTGMHVFGIGGKPILCVPESDLNPDLMGFNDESTHLEPGNGHTPGFAAFFSLAEMRRRFGTRYSSDPVFGNSPALTGLEVTVTLLSDADAHRLGPAMRARDIDDIWHGTGACPNATTQPLAGSHLYVARCSPNSSYSSLWNRNRNSKEEMPNGNTFVVATCDYDTIAFGPYKGHDLRECTRILIFDGFMIDYRFTEQNAVLIEQFDAFLKDKIAQWRNNCSKAI